VKRIALAVTDTRFLCIHSNPDDCEDLDVLEERHIVPEKSLSCEKAEVLQ
jgi:hypothetical protein